MNKELILLLVVALLWLHYIVFILRIRLGLMRLSVPLRINKQCTVSVVVAVHNEESNIQHCLASLLDQSYSEGKTEIIVVDDESTDGTAEVVRSLALTQPRIRLVSLESKTTRVRNRKPEAIAEGIRTSSGEIIFTTDADCSPPCDWITSMMAYFDDETAFVAGPVRESGATNLLGRLSSIEFLGLIASSAGLIGNQSPIFCNGANLAYRKAVFLSAGGFGDRFASCDDELLLQRIHTRGLGTIKYSVDPRSIVLTRPMQSLAAFLWQRIRWASKRGHYERWGILLTLVALYFNFLSLLILACLSFFIPTLWLPLLFFFFGKAVVDYATLRKAESVFHQSFPLVEFIVAELFHVPYIICAAFLGQIIVPQWKGTRTAT